MKPRSTTVRMALVLALLLGSLTLVVWRQSHALAVLRELESVRRERVVEEARRSALGRRVEQLESRTRVSAAARTRFDMRLPSGDEIVILPLAPSPTGLAATGSKARSGEG